jgi:hypothetical protein
MNPSRKFDADQPAHIMTQSQVIGKQGGVAHDEARR